MTFDKAQQLLLDNVTDEEARPLVVYVMSVLKDTYVPTVEMTREEFTQFRFYLNNAKLLALLTDNSFGINQEDGEDLFNHLTQEDLAQAWLHPECVKVIDDEKD